MPTTLRSPSSSPSSSSSSSSKAPAPIIPIAISALAVLFLGSLMLLTFHFRRQNKKKISAARARKGREAQPGETVSRTHPAALMITPAEGKGTPRFIHTPGTNMRIATRRADGAWDFADPRAPFTPAIIPPDATLPTSRNSSAASSINERSSAPRTRSPSPAHSLPYSHASYSYDTRASGSTAELLPPPTAASASPWGAPTTPRTADSDLPVRSPWRQVHSPTPSASSSMPFLPASSISGSSRRSSVVSSHDSFLDLDGEPSGSTYANPFLSPAPSGTPSRGARWQGSPLRSPPASARSSPEPPATRVTESRAARALPRGYEDVDRGSAYAEQSGNLRSARASPEPSRTPAALAKEAESRAAREIRRGYERVDRTSEYAEQDEGLPSY
ncbi:hypothetical protein C8R44DRAFT_822716 [Mycena epipterygia]|nr:hypothetical protein C8R44DRAFT_822716 [Mycena epipterygia]